MGERSVHAFGPRGWYEATGHTPVSLRAVLRASGAMRKVPAACRARVAEIYADPLRNRTFAFLDAVLGPRAALAALDNMATLVVGVVGCGGIGSAAAYLLAGMGVKTFHFVAPDVVEEGNLSRQVLYTLADIGRSKVEALAGALRNRFRSLDAIVHCGDALATAAVENLASCDVVVCAGDDPPTLASELHLRLKNVPIWTCGYALGRSVVRAPTDTARASRSAAVDWFSIPHGFAPSVGFQNLEIAAACVARLTFALACGPRATRGESLAYRLDYTTW